MPRILRGVALWSAHPISRSATATSSSPRRPATASANGGFEGGVVLTGSVALATTVAVLTADRGLGRAGRRPCRATFSFTGVEMSSRQSVAKSRFPLHGVISGAIASWLRARESHAPLRFKWDRPPNRANPESLKTCAGSKAYAAVCTPNAQGIIGESDPVHFLARPDSRAPHQAKGMGAPPRQIAWSVARAQGEHGSTEKRDQILPLGETKMNPEMAPGNAPETAPEGYSKPVSKVLQT